MLPRQLWTHNPQAAIFCQEYFEGGGYAGCAYFGPRHRSALDQMGFVLAFAVPCFIVIAAGGLPFVLSQRIGPYDVVRTFVTLVIVMPCLATVLAISWFRTLLRPAQYPTPLRSLRGQPLWPFRHRGSSPERISLVFGFLLLASRLPQILAGLCVFALGLSLPGIAALGASPARAPIRYSVRHLHHAFVILLVLSLVQALAQIQIWNFLHIGQVPLTSRFLGLTIPRTYNQDLANIHFVIGGVVVGLIWLVKLGVLAGYYREFTMT